MNLLFLALNLFAFQLKAEIQNNYNEPCIGPNTFRDKDGECECTKEFPYGDPDSKEGCFKCDIHCHKNAICGGMNKCVCKPSFIGDGISSCIPIFPLPINVKPNAGSFHGHYLVNITLENETSSSTVYCRFGNIIVAGKMLNKKIISCLAPSGYLGKIELRVSNNPNDWNLPGISFEYKFYAFCEYGIITAEIIVIIIILIVVIVSILFFKEKLSSTNQDDLQPLKYATQITTDHSDLSLQGFYPL